MSLWLLKICWWWSSVSSNILQLYFALCRLFLFCTVAFCFKWLHTVTLTDTQAFKSCVGNVIPEKSITSKVHTQTHKWTNTHRNTQKDTKNTNFPLLTKGVNVKCCFYLMIRKLKDYLTWQTADEALICSLMFPPSPSITSSQSLCVSPKYFSHKLWFWPLETTDLVFSPSLLSASKCCFL